MGLLLCLAVPAAAGDDEDGHPHFDDKGTLPWFTKLTDAQSAARKEGKLVFIEYGRKL
jgi:hypothetical protein